MKAFLFGLTIWLSFSLRAATPEAVPEATLEDQLQSLNVPANQAPSAISSEKLYSVQTRFNPLSSRFEVNVGGSRNFTPNSFLNSSQVEAAIRYHFDDRWSLGLEGSYVFNSLTDAGERLLNAENIFPDVAYSKYRVNLMTSFNAFVGKFRLTMDQVFYFDQYFALGPGLVSLNTGNQLALVGDIGFVFWMGKNISLRLGLQDFFFHENRVLSSGYVHHLLGHMDLGLLL